MVLGQSLGTRLLAAVAVVLLIDAVELEQGLRVIAKCRCVFEELLLDEPSQVVAGGFDRLVLRQAVEGRKRRNKFRGIRQMSTPP